MYNPFPDNYLWWLNTMAALDMGVELYDVEQVCQSLRADASAGTLAWVTAWTELGRRLESAAAEDRERGRRLSAGAKDLQAAGAFVAAERVLEIEDDDKLPAYERYLTAFGRGIADAEPGVERVDVPFESTSLPALFVPARGEGPRPTLILVNGLDGTKELIYLWVRSIYAERGVALLLVDQPGVGGALRHRDLKCRHDAETYVGAAVDYLEQRPEVDAESIGVIGISLGGYYAPRAAAFESRLKCCITWGALWDLSAVLGHMIDSASNSVQISSHVPWVMGESDAAPLKAKIEQFRLDDVIDRVTCPLLIAHGQNDRQVELWQAERTYERAINATRKELRVFTPDEGGAEHVQLDRMSDGVREMADWAAEVLGAGLVAEPASGGIGSTASS